MDKHSEILRDLATPFHPRLIYWRVGHVNESKSEAQALPYVDKYVIMQRFDDVLGVNWDNEMKVHATGLVSCRIGIFLDGKWCYREDGTASPQLSSGNSQNDKADQARKMGEKAAFSDAFKRAARK